MHCRSHRMTLTSVVSGLDVVWLSTIGNAMMLLAYDAKLRRAHQQTLCLSQATRHTYSLSTARRSRQTLHVPCQTQNLSQSSTPREFANCLLGLYLILTMARHSQVGAYFGAASAGQSTYCPTPVQRLMGSVRQVYSHTNML